MMQEKRLSYRRSALQSDFNATGHYIYLYFATVVILLYVPIDFVILNGPWQCFIWRILYFPFVFLAMVLCRKIFSKSRAFYEMPAILGSIYIGLMATYMSVRAGGFNSSYTVTLVQLCLGLSLLPLRLWTNVAIVLLTWGLFIFFNVEYSAGEIERTQLIWGTTLGVFSLIMQWASLQIRFAKYDAQQDLKLEVESRESLILAQSQRLANAESDAAVGELVVRVAHDIRSPVAALKAALINLDVEPEQYSLIRGAADRIQSIAKDLLNSNKERGSRLGVNDAIKLDDFILSDLIDELMAEKRSEFSKFQKLRLLFKVDSEAQMEFVRVSKSNLQRSLSNLINNAAEAMNFDGDIIVHVRRYDTILEIEIIDSGPGIPEAMLPLLGRKSVSFGKSNGSGLGLVQVGKTLEEIDGRLIIDSKAGSGTKMKICVPVAALPSWAANQILIPPNTDVCIVDDDYFIHDIWRRRFSDVNLNILIHFVSRESELEQIIKPHRNRDLLFLVDFWLRSDARTGLDVISDFGIGSKSILISSRFDDPAFRAAALKAKIRCISKRSITSIPIHTTA